MTEEQRQADRTHLLELATDALEWPKVLEWLVGRAQSALGAEQLRALALETQVEAARERLAETTEMVAFEQGADVFPSMAFPDIREPLGRAGKGAVLEPHELRDIWLALGRAVTLHGFLSRHRARAPALAQAARGLDAAWRLASLRELLEEAVDPEGHIRESATPELRRLSARAQELKQAMRRRLDLILASARYGEVLQEQYFAQREGRYVIPVKAEMRSRIPGIVHDVSSSGATIFLEPRELVDLNNAIKVAELEVQREITRLLHDLSRRVAEETAAIQEALEVLAKMDAIAAKAAFSRAVKGAPVQLTERGPILLRQARHPLLVLNRADVVANDILLDESVRVLVISGPNTGGKTVTLKIIGLTALMVRAGLLPACGPDSEVPVFSEVYADIGDTQDLAKDLSSFSAHITQMIRLLAHAGEAARVAGRAPRALVLLDELATSTDPAEGAALAEALLKRLAALGLTVIVTTHYQSLKALAQTTTGFVNASVEFDVEALAPTYRLLLGLPGGSAALEIAGRLGLEQGVLTEARELLRGHDRVLERLLVDLQETKRRLDEEMRRATALRSDAEQAAREATEITQRLRATEREEQKRFRRRLTDELLRARSEVQSILDDLKREASPGKARGAKARINEVEQQWVQVANDSAEAVPLETLEAGATVEINRFGTTGTLLEPVHGKKRVRVRVGENEVSVPVSGLVGVVRVDRDEKRGDVQSRVILQRSEHRGASTAGEVDVRGRSVEEAIELVVTALDHATMQGGLRLRIIHGHGTGRLKTALRDYLKTSPYVVRARPADRAEGGDGATIAELRP